MANRSRRKGERGYIMVMLLATMVFMGYAAKTAAPYVFWEVQREAEEEAIFRGKSIMRAIKAYHAKHRTYPTKLEQLMEMKPRVLRKLYKDPLTREGEWELIPAVDSPTGNITGLPIVGVRSRSKKDSIKLYNGKSLHCDWKFSAVDNPLDNIPGMDKPGGKPKKDKEKPSPSVSPVTPIPE